MKHSMLKVGLALTSISILIVTILLFSAFRDTTPQDIDEIRFSIIAPMKLRYRWECLLRQTEKVLL